MLTVLTRSKRRGYGGKTSPQSLLNHFLRIGKRSNSLEWIPVLHRDSSNSGEILSQKMLGAASKEPAVSLPIFVGIFESNMLIIIKELRKIFKRYGWGTANFRMEGCRKKLIEWREKEHEEYLRESRANRSPSPPDPLDEFSD